MCISPKTLPSTQPDKTIPFTIHEFEEPKESLYNKPTSPIDKKKKKRRRDKRNYVKKYENKKSAKGNDRNTNIKRNKKRSNTHKNQC